MSDTVDHPVGDLERGTRLHLLAAISFVVIGVATCLSSVIFVERIHTVLLGLSSIFAAITLHIFSTGNTVFSCAASLRDEALFDEAEQINRNGIVTTVGTAAVFATGIAWVLVANAAEIVAITEFAVPRPTLVRLQAYAFGVLRMVFLAGVGVFSTGVALQDYHSGWHDTVRERIANQERSQADSQSSISYPTGRDLPPVPNQPPPLT